MRALISGFALSDLSSTSAGIFDPAIASRIMDVRVSTRLNGNYERDTAR